MPTAVEHRNNRLRRYRNKTLLENRLFDTFILSVSARTFGTRRQDRQRTCAGNHPNYTLWLQHPLTTLSVITIERF
jgi:hypothetical protein